MINMKQRMTVGEWHYGLNYKLENIVKQTAYNSKYEKVSAGWMKLFYESSPYERNKTTKLMNNFTKPYGVYVFTHDKFTVLW